MSELFFIRLSQDPRLVQWGLGRAAVLSAHNDAVQTGSLEQALEASKAQSKNQQVVLIVPAADIVLNSVELPIRQHSKLLQAVPYALEDQLAEDVEQLHFSVGERQPDGQVPVASVARASMAGYLEPFQAQGIEPLAVLPETLCLPQVQADGGWQVLVDGRNCVVRNGAFDGFSCDIDELGDFLSMAQSSMDLPEGLRLTVYQTPGSDSLALDGLMAHVDRVEVRAGLACLMPASLNGNINLLQGDYASEPAFERWWRPLRATAILFLTWVLLGTAYDAIQHVRLSGQLETLEEENITRFRQLFPEISRVVDMRAQGQQALAKLRQDGSGAGLFPLLGATANAVKTVNGLRVQEVQLRDGLLYMSLTAADIQTLESFKAHFGKQEAWQLEVQSANAGSDGVQIRASLKGGAL